MIAARTLKNTAAAVSKLPMVGAGVAAAVAEKGDGGELMGKIEEVATPVAPSRRVNTSFVERHNGTDRGRCGRKGRKSYEFSKSWTMHVAATRFSYFSDNFCWCVRTLRVKGDDGRYQARTAAMAA